MGVDRERVSSGEKNACLERLEGYLKLGGEFQNPPKIKLKLISSPPSGGLVGAESVASSTAIQCYAPGVARMINREDQRARGIAESTLNAGHHTTRMHTHYTFHLIGVTRSVTHDVLHATPFYNSEQQSQRYVKAKEGNFLVPSGLNREQVDFYKNAADFANRSYLQLLKILEGPVRERVRQMYPPSGWKVETTRERLEKKIQKLSQEIARYVLPIGQHTIYFYTLNELQLLRLFRSSNMPGFTDEAKFIIASMIYEVSKHDPSILDELRYPVDNDSSLEGISINRKQFDSLLGGKTSILLEAPDGIGREFLEAVAKSPLMGDVFNSGMFSPAISRMREIWFTFATKLSHTADSQRQRHRRTASGVTNIQAAYTGDVDFVTPLVIRENPEIRWQYEEIVNKMFENVERALEMGIPREVAVLLLPNAMTIRVIESGDLLDWINRWKQRLCFLAQEEIFFASVDQVEDVLAKVPQLTPVLLAPCGIRKATGISPRCPEGNRWCGQPVYNWSIEEYSKKRLI